MYIQGEFNSIKKIFSWCGVVVFFILIVFLNAFHIERIVEFEVFQERIIRSMLMLFVLGGVVVYFSIKNKQKPILLLKDDVVSITYFWGLTKTIRIDAIIKVVDKPGRLVFIYKEVGVLGFQRSFPLTKSLFSLRELSELHSFLENCPAINYKA